MIQTILYEYGLSVGQVIIMGSIIGAIPVVIVGVFLPTWIERFKRSKMN